MTNISISATMSKEDAIARIETLAELERVTKSEIAVLANEAVAYLWNHGTIDIVNRLVAAITPANRTAVVLLVKEVTSYSYDQKEKRFTGLSSHSKSEKEDKLAKLNKYMTAYQGNIWVWFETTKEKKIVEFKFNEQALVKQLAGWLASKGEFGSDFEALLVKAKTAAQKELDKAAYIAERVKHWVSGGLDMELATKAAEKDFDNGVALPTQA